MKKRIGLLAGSVALFTFLVLQYGVLPSLASNWPYPRYGYATDFSWVAGQVVDRRIVRGCIYIRYQETPTNSASSPPQVMASGLEANVLYTDPTLNGSFVVAFGHLHRPGTGAGTSLRAAPAPSAATDRCVGLFYTVDRLERVPVPGDLWPLAAGAGLLAGGVVLALQVLYSRYRPRRAVGS
jgi:hypothetical protein